MRHTNPSQGEKIPKPKNQDPQNLGLQWGRHSGPSTTGCSLLARKLAVILIFNKGNGCKETTGYLLSGDFRHTSQKTQMQHTLIHGPVGSSHEAGWWAFIVTMLLNVRGYVVSQDVALLLKYWWMKEARRSFWSCCLQLSPRNRTGRKPDHLTQWHVLVFSSGGLWGQETHIFFPT